MGLRLKVVNSSARRRRGRTAPFNGSVTRADIEAIYREFARGEVWPEPTTEEFRQYLVGAIEDRPITDAERRRRSVAMTNLHLADAPADR